MKRKNGFFVMALAVAAIVTSCGTSGIKARGDWKSVEFVSTSETDIGSDVSLSEENLKAAGYSESNPLKIALVTDSGTLNDHSFNESSYKGVKEIAVKGGGKVVNDVVSSGLINCKAFQPQGTAGYEFTTADRVTAMKNAVNDFGAKVLVLPGYLFQDAIYTALTTEKETFKDVYLLALDCVAQQGDNYESYDYTDHVTSVIYREEQAGFLAGYAAAMDGYNKFGFIGGMAVPAVVRYGSGYVQGIAKGMEDRKATSPATVNYYYANAFTSTADATAKAKSWYSSGSSEIIFACGGSVYQSVVEASASNSYASWIGVDVNQHSDTSLGSDTLKALKTSAMKNLQSSVEVLLTSWVKSGSKWSDKVAAKVNTVGATSGMCKLPTPEEDDDASCWGFENYSVSDYKSLYTKLKSGEIKVNFNSDNTSLTENNFGVDPTYCIVNPID